MVIVDTPVWFDSFAGDSKAETEWLDVETGNQWLGITDVTQCEILQGARSDTEFRILNGEMLKYEDLQPGAGRLRSPGSQARIHAPRDHRLLDRHVLLEGRARTSSSRPRIRTFRKVPGVARGSSMN